MARRKKEIHPLLVGIESVEPYQLTDSQTLYDEKAPPMLIEEFLPAGGMMGITSYPGVGKTWLTLEIVRAIATGRKFLGRFPTQRGGVVFIGSDSSRYDYARQWKRLTQAMEVAHDGDGSLFDSARFLLESPFMFESTDELRRLVATCRKFEWGEAELRGEGTEHAHFSRNHGVELIICDTVSKLTRANQNDNSEMEEVFRNIRALSTVTGAAVILLHHNSKKSEFNDGSDWRGAMSQIGALDSWCHLTPSRKDKYLIGVQFKKFRGITPEDFAYRMDVNDPNVANISASDEPVTMQQRLNHDPLAEAIGKAIVEQPGRTQPELRDAIWPQFKDTEHGNNVLFTDQAQFTKAIDNRMRTMVGRGRVTKKYNDQGRPVYGTAEAPEAQ
jgi:hypothetical protein